MNKLSREEQHKRLVLANERATALLADLYRPRSEEEKQKAAEALGVKDWLPEPQGDLPL